MNIGIVGLGLMGGSFAKAVKKYGIVNKIYGYARTPKTIKEIEELNLVDELMSLEDLKKKSDIVILAIPVDSILDMMDDLIGISPDTTILDMGSTKEIIVKNIPKEIRKNFVAAHPMTGTEKFGPKAAIDGLYEGNAVVLCNLEDNDELHKNRTINIFQEIGMRIIFMDSHEHDIHACYMSHLPHAISYSLANTVMNHEDPKSIIALAAGGFKDMSRVAKSSPDMWTDIFRQNRNNLLESIDLFEIHMNKVREMVEKEDYEELKNWMKKANTLHEIL
ncbi:prephenate dehydrogenase [Arcobacter sp. LA11]|uniref:prephenate dehydrogenase n=1 Tax=Arcobacter sp. LA11 TaxID=1898176 RepID=UPI0009351865|nr:prephenate dehydrogenase [Arcobacter sp. LA11]